MGLSLGMVRIAPRTTPFTASCTREVLANRRIVWYFFNDIYPSTHGGYRPMDPPQWWCRLFERGALDAPVPDSDIHAAALNRDVAAPAVPDVR